MTNSRPQKRLSGTWRRHLCLSCGAIFSSLERVDYAGSLSFQNDRSHIVPFDRDKLFISLYEACKHRKSAIMDATALTNTVISIVLKAKSQRGLVRRAELIAAANKVLKAFDRAAHVYYAAYHH